MYKSILNGTSNEVYNAKKRQKFNGHLDPKEPISGVGVWRLRQFERVARQFQLVSGARRRPRQMMLKVQLWHKQHLKDQTEARTLSTRRKSNAVGVFYRFHKTLWCATGNEKRCFGSGSQFITTTISHLL
jgi:hypothetical protein